VSVPDFVEWLEFQEVSEEVLRYEICFRPRTILKREHVHPHQSERHEVVSGRMKLKLDGVVQTLTESLQQYPLDMAPTSLTLTDDAVDVHLEGGQYVMPPQDPNAPKSGCSIL